MRKPMRAIPEAETAFEHRLRREIEGEVRFDRVSRALYSTIASVYQIVPLGVVIPADVRRRLADSHCVPGTWSVDHGAWRRHLSGRPGRRCGTSNRFFQVFESSPRAALAERKVRVEPGIVLDELNAFLKPYGLQLPLDISTSDRATIGGMHRQ